MSKISVCTITKNEEKNIGKMLESLKPYDFEIVILDTGSTDKTKEIAQRYTDRVYDFEWIDDFSAARNHAAYLASNDWILMMDADEWVEKIDLEELNYFMKKCADSLGSVWLDSETGTPENKGPISRIHIERFYNKKNYKYKKPIHEQLAPKHSGILFKNLQLNSYFGHSGYCMDEETRIRKAERNVSMLLKQLKDEGEGPYIYYQLGKGYIMKNDPEKACEYFGKGLEFDIDPELDYVSDMVVQYGQLLLELGRKEEALGFEGIKEEFSHTADFVYLMGQIYFENELYQQAVDEFQKALTIENYRTEGINTYLPAYQIGRILIMAGQKEQAGEYLRACGEFPPAKELLSTLK